LVKELRERTGADMMTCKKALTQADGDIENAFKAIQEAGPATTKTPRSSGVVSLLIDGTYGCVVEINCQTDLVAKDQNFAQFADKVAKAALDGRVSDIDKLKHTFEGERASLAAKVGEVIEIRQIARLEGRQVAGYANDTRAAALVSTRGASSELSKQIAMHVAAMKPAFLKPGDVSEEIAAVEFERQCQREAASGKPRDEVEMIVKGQMKNFFGEISLTEQPFVVDQTCTVGQVLKSEGAEISSFVRVELGGSCLVR
jgi:elongation factor Ts